MRCDVDDLKARQNERETEEEEIKKNWERDNKSVGCRGQRTNSNGRRGATQMCQSSPTTAATTNWRNVRLSTPLYVLRGAVVGTIRKIKIW